MVRSARVLFVLAALAGTAVTTARAQAPAPTFAPAPLPGPYFEPDPLLDRAPLPPPGWFADADLGVVIPHVKNKLVGQVQVGAAANPDTVQVGGAALDWTVLPRFELGYRLPSGFGACSLSYRFFGSQGTEAAAGLHSRLDLNDIGLDYSNNETSLWPNWDMKWSVGLRLIYVYFDSRADELPTGIGIFERRDSNWFAGFGPHVGLELDRQIGCTGLAWVGRVDVATYFGRVRQGFFEQGAALAGETRVSGSQAVPNLAGFTGLRWQPPAWNNAAFFLGYQYEHWWSLGKLGASSAELSEQGVFVRAEFNF